MSKLTKEMAKRHKEARDLVALHRPLTEDEKEFVLEHWQESSTSVNSLDGAFFTPLGLARDLALEVSGLYLDRVLDLCAGIGRIAWHCFDLRAAPNREVVCVERNPEYVKVGRKILPEARWVCADIFDLPRDLGQFDMVVSNPPYGAVERTGNGPGVTSRRFEYHAIAVAAEVAPNGSGAFLIPQQSAPFRHNSVPTYEEVRSAEYEQFERDTGLQLGMGCAINTDQYRREWRGVAPVTEVAVCDFPERSPRAVTPSPAALAAHAPTRTAVTAGVEAAPTLF